MTLLYRYLLKEFLKPLVFSTAAFGCLVLISEFFRELNFYLENKTPFLVVARLLALNLPWWTIQVLPVSVLLAVLFSLSQLARHGEINAIKAAGINLWRVIILFMLCGIGIGIVDTGLRELVIPRAVKAAELLKSEKIHHEKKSVEFEFRNIVVSLPDNGRMTVGYLNTKDMTIRSIVLDFFDRDFNLARQVVADQALWQPGKGTWRMNNGVTRIFEGGGWRESYFSSRNLKVAIKPSDFIIKRLRPEQMNTKEFREYIRHFATLGIPSEKEQIQFHLRYASAFSHMVVMMIGIPFAVGLGSRHGKIISFTFALIFAFIYWGVQAVGQSLGQNHFVSPLAAAWLGNIIFGAFGAYLLSGVKK